jgi:hypothetical protein
VYALWSVGNCIRAAQREEGKDSTSCPARRNINMFPRRAGKPPYKNIERSRRQ